MMTCSLIILMASYNEWMNAKLYEAAGTLPPEELIADRNAFFHSIIGTLNHLVVADTLWLKRFATHPSSHHALDPVRNLQTPRTLDEWLFSDIAVGSRHRTFLDGIIRQWAMELAEEDFLHVLCYSNMKGIEMKKDFFSVVMHFFNHQTHHRGQITTLLSQAGIDVGVTDLVALIPNEMGS